MKITKLGDLKVVMENKSSKHNYFGWPSVGKTNDKIIVAASGFRLNHVCPFGKAVISVSHDEGESYTAPAPIIDTVLDDRDGGILCAGNKVIVTSFNNTRNFQREVCGKDDIYHYGHKEYKLAYINSVDDDEEAAAFGSLYRISYDGGTTFGEIKKSPVTSPHGPIALKDGRILWIGQAFQDGDFYPENETHIQVYEIKADETMEYVGKIENVEGYVSCEPHAIQLDSGRILCHIRVQESGGDQNYFTIYQSESDDLGKTWTRPHRILSETGGAPAHLIKHSSGALLSLYGYRKEPYGIKVMVSYDDGETWDIDNELYIDNISRDLGYPSTVELKDKSLLTVFYAHYPTKESPAIILQQKWSFEK